jgi:hypothetical protein
MVGIPIAILHRMPPIPQALADPLVGLRFMN